MTKWRPITRPLLGKTISDVFDRIEELERFASSRSGSAGYGGGGAAGGANIIGTALQAGEAVTGGGGSVTVTFPVAYPATPVVVVSVLNSGSDQLVAAIESISTTQVVISVGKIADQGSSGLYTGAGEAHRHAFSGVTTDHTHGPGTYAAAAHDHAPGTFAAAAHDHSSGTLSAAAHDHAPGTFNVTIPAGTDGTSGNFGVAGVSASSGPHSVSGVTGSSGPHSVSGVSAQSGPHSVSGQSGLAGGGTINGYTDYESTHRHPAPADNVLHAHGRTLVAGVGVRWFAMPKTA